MVTLRHRLQARRPARALAPTRASWATRAALVAGAAASLLVPASAEAQAAPRARADAAAAAFVDGDVAWMLPLLDAAAADRRRAEASTAAEIEALAAHGAADASAARVARLRAGADAALGELRRHSPDVAAPPGARYDAACSAALTEAGAALTVTAAFAVRDVPAAAEFYRARGWRVLGGLTSGFVLVSPDGRLRGSLASRLAEFRRVAADVERRGLQGYDHVKACTGIPDRAALVLHPDNPLETETRAAAARATGERRERLPAALRAAGLSAGEWQTILDALWQAEMDRLMPDTPSPAPASAEDASRRRANVRWLERNRARVGPSLQATSTDG
jgi:hypothetical protein